MEETLAAQGQTKSFAWACRSDYYRIGCVIGCTLSALQQFTGINVIISQSSNMFGKIVSPEYVTTMTCVVGVVNVLLTDSLSS